MPTVNFTPIPAQALSKGSQLDYPGGALSTRLAILPVATESWTVEGFSLNLTATYLEQVLMSVEGQRTAINAQIGHINEAIAQYQSAAEKAGGESAEGKGFLGAERALEAERSALERERNELGFAEGTARIAASPLVITAAIYTHGSELVSLSTLDTFRQPTSVLTKVFEPAFGTFVRGTFRETFAGHIQFQPSIDLDERQQLLLVLTVIGPGPTFGEEGIQLEKTGVNGVVNVEATASINYTAEQRTAGP